MNISFNVNTVNVYINDDNSNNGMASANLRKLLVGRHLIPILNNVLSAKKSFVATDKDNQPVPS